MEIRTEPTIDAKKKAELEEAVQRAWAVEAMVRRQTADGALLSVVQSNRENVERLAKAFGVDLQALKAPK